MDELSKEGKKMNNLVQKLIEYVDTRDSSVILSNVEVSDVTNLTVAVLTILDWLKLEGKREKWISEGRKISLKNKELDVKQDWCKLLIQIVERESLFNSYFEIKNNCLSFKDSVSEDERSQMRKKANEDYHPIVTAL